MPTKHQWRLLLGLIIILTVSGCSSDLNAKNEGNKASSNSDGPTFTLIVGNKELIAKSDKLLRGSYRKGMTIHQLLTDSGMVSFSGDGTTILSISNVSLAPEIQWELQMNGETIKDTAKDHTVDNDSNIVITAKSGASTEPLQYVLLTVNGGNDQEQLTHSYVMLFIEDISVRSLLKSVDRVQLSEDNKNVISVSDYIPFSKEVWKLKVNGKLLRDNGMDMKLRPQDELEILLASR